MCVSTTNGETSNHMIQEKEPTKDEDTFAMDDSAVILNSYRGPEGATTHQRRQVFETQHTRP
jgi:hypothetical protein